MIRYDLKCDRGHNFDGWFASDAAFGKLRGSGMIACTVCGSEKIEKALMAPAVHAPAPKPAAAGSSAEPGAAMEPARPLAQPRNPLEEAFAQMRRSVEENSDYVGANFVQEARAMHEGETPERAIWGEARPDEARALIEDGIQVTPLPFMGPRKAN